MSYELYLANDRGERLQLLDKVVRFNYSKTINGIGRGQFVFPDSYDFTLFKRDYRIEVFRSPSPTASKKLENIYFIRRRIGDTLAGGQIQLNTFASDPNELLMRRIVAYNSGSSEADKTDEIDDMMKAIVRENMGTLAAADRDWTASGFSVQVDVSLGPSITKAFSRRNVLDVLQDLSEAARTNGTEVYFAVVPTTTTTFEFQTFIEQPGVDRRYEGEDPLVFSLERGNLGAPMLEDDYEDEISYVYAGGQGEGDTRDIQVSSDNALINESIWNRREGFRDARHQSASAGVLTDADAMLSASRPRRRFHASLLSVKNSRYGIDWNWGDRVTVEYLGQRLNALVRSVSVSVDRNGDETVMGRVEIEDAT